MAASVLTERRAASRSARLGGVAALLCCMCAPTGAAETIAKGGPVQLEAASSRIDYGSNTVVFSDIVITQGGVRVAAERARATGLEFDDATWTFSGGVNITVDGGALRSSEATVIFRRNEISKAVIVGQPAEFEQQRHDSAEKARGRAGSIEYDVPAGVVTLRADAWLTDGRNEISGQELVYDIKRQQVQAQTQPGDTDRVRITIRPKTPTP